MSLATALKSYSAGPSFSLEKLEIHAPPDSTSFFTLSYQNGCRVTALRVVGGVGGWRRTAPPDGANRRAGVLLSTLATTLAAVVGETVRLDGAVDRVLSTTVARWGDTAAAALGALCSSPSGSTPVPWYVGLDGITVLGTRTGAAVEADPLDGPVGRTYLFGDDAPLLALLPGATIDGRTIISLRVTADADKVRAEAVVS